jgi:ankyrin repeat protein
VKIAAAPKPPATEERKPEPAPVLTTRPRIEPVAASLPQPSALSPKFNDVMTAVLYRDRAAVTQLLDLGRWADKRDSNGLTPLMVATMIGDAGMVGLLLERGADPDLQAPGGLTALDFALQSGDSATTQLLQRSGAR